MGGRGEEKEEGNEKGKKGKTQEVERKEDRSPKSSRQRPSRPQALGTYFLTLASPLGILRSFFFLRILTALRHKVSESSTSFTLPYEPSPSRSPIRYLPMSLARLRRGW